MKNPSLSIKIIYDSLEETLKALQGTSRYINAIYLPKNLIIKEGISTLNLLVSRYPTKKIILDLSDHQKNDRFFVDVVNESNVQHFIISGDSKSQTFIEMCRYIKNKNKKVIWKTNEVNWHFFNQFSLDAFFYFKKENKDNLDIWTKQDLQKIQQIYDHDIYCIVGEVLKENIATFEGVSVNEFIISQILCSSFNPIETCKEIYFMIKETFKVQDQ